MEHINDILLAIKKASSIILIPTEKNRNTKYRLGLVNKDLVQLVKDLKAIDYVSGPEDDYNGTEGSIWIFKKFAYGVFFYIKIKNVKPLKIISCHIDNIN